MRKAVVFTMFLMSSLSPVLALQKKPVLKLDSSVTNLQPLDQAAIERLKTNPEFIYTELPPESMSLWDKFWIWVWDQIYSLLEFTSSNPITKWGFIILGIILLGFLIYKFLKLNKLFVANSGQTNVEYQVTPDDIHQIDYEKELRQLILDANYRLAVRLLYLRSLKHLSDHKLIHWQPGKTNQAYLNEVESRSVRQPFSVLTQQFDYIWYGRFPIDEQAFNTLHKSFDAFIGLVK